MKLFLTLFLLLSSFSIFAQKVEVKDSVINVDNIPYARIEAEGGGFQQKTVTISDLSNKPVIVIRYYNTNIISKKMASNPNGTVFFADFSFLQSKQKGQVESYFVKLEKIAKHIVKSKLFKDGKIDEEAVGNFVLINPIVYTKN